MRKTTRNQKDREAQFDIAAHKRELDRLLRENAKLKAQKLTLERELALRPPYSEPDPSLSQASVLAAFRALQAPVEQQAPPQ